MAFDFTITFGNVLTLLTFLGAIVVMFVRHRDAIADVKSASSGRCALLEQAHDFLKQQLNEDRARSDSHWSEVKLKLDKISDQLNQKADKP